jgi:hypothetical protein
MKKQKKKKKKKNDLIPKQEEEEMAMELERAYRERHRAAAGGASGVGLLVLRVQEPSLRGRHSHLQLHAVVLAASEEGRKTQKEAEEV